MYHFHYFFLTKISIHFCSNYMPVRTRIFLQSEGFVSSSGYVGFTLQVTPTVIIPKPGRLYHQSFLLECQFDRSESSGFPVCFLPRHWCGCVPAPRVRRNPDRCRYRYICRTVGLPARGSCRPKQIRFLLRGRLKMYFR